MLNYTRFYSSTWIRLLYVFLAILIVKIVFLILDPTPAYFLGDSESYLATATIRWMPPDRSFLYGLLIRRLSYHSHSLERLIYFQVLCSAIASWLVCFALSRYFHSRFWIAATFGMLCAVEPLQLMMERYVMTEATSNLLFAGHFVLLLAYMRQGRLWTLLLADSVGVLSIGIRISFLPELLLTSVLAPLLSPQAIGLWRSMSAKVRGVRPERSVRGASKVMVHLVLCVLVSQGLLIGYKRLNGRLSHREPGLLYASGTFLLSDFAPLVEPEDFPITAKRDAVFKNNSINRYDPAKRAAQHFMQGGLIAAIYSQFPDDKQANDLASATAIHALIRQPLGGLKLAAWTLSCYFDPTRLRDFLLVDEGKGGHMSASTINWLRNIYRVRNPSPYELTLTKRWHLLAVPWYWLILCTLAVSPFLLLTKQAENQASIILCIVTALIFFEGATLTVDRATPRFLTTDAWLVLLMLGVVVSSLFSRENNSKSLRSVYASPSDRSSRGKNGNKEIHASESNP